MDASGDRALDSGEPAIQVALTIAGSDSSGASGIQADLRTFQALQVYGVTVVTAVTVQDTVRAEDVSVLPSALVAAQLDALGRDLTPGAIKVGMLGSRRNVEVVAARLRRAGTPPVILDPVLRSTSGRELLDPDALGALRTELLPAALLLTPNVMEAETLLGVRIRSVADMEAAARELCRMGPSHVLIKGGHMAGEDVVDVFSDGNACRSISRARIAHEARGTGCVLSSAVAAHLALGFDLWAAWVAAADFTARAIRSGFRVGQGIVSNPGGISARLPQGSPAP